MLNFKSINRYMVKEIFLMEIEVILLSFNFMNKFLNKYLSKLKFYILIIDKKRKTKFDTEINS